MRKIALGYLLLASLSASIPAAAQDAETESTPSAAAFDAAAAWDEFEQVLRRAYAYIERDDIDAVYVPLPTDLHCEWVIKALAAKKHVLVEKPIALTVSEVKAMFAAAKTHGRLLMEGYMSLHTAQHRQLLGQRRLNNAQQLFQLADIALAVHQLAKQQQTVTIGQCLQQLMGLIGRTAQALDISLVVHDSSTISCNTLLTNNI